MSNISSTGLVKWALKGWASTFVQAIDSLPTGVWGAGAEACPPPLEMLYSRFSIPFSAMPISPQGSFTPGNTSCTTAPPSSSTRAGVMPFSANQLTMFTAPLPFTSSPPEKAK